MYEAHEVPEIYVSMGDAFGVEPIKVFGNMTVAVMAGGVPLC
jgi:hypothetical protein